MKSKKLIYFLIILPLILTSIAMIALPNEVVIRYSSKGVQYGSKFSLIIFPFFSIWIGGFMLLVGKAVEKTEQENVVKNITYIPLIIFNLVTIAALLGAGIIKEGKTNLQMLDIIVGGSVEIVAILFAVYASFTARQKGPIISNSYLWLSKEEREKTDKKPEYRQLTIVCGGLAVSFTMLAIYIIASWKWAYVMMWIIMALVVVYAIASSVKDVLKNK